MSVNALYKDIITSMRDGETRQIPLDGTETYALVHRFNSEYILYEGQEGGGKPQFDGVYKTAEKVIEAYKRWK
jgi:hypothetical protein